MKGFSYETQTKNIKAVSDNIYLEYIIESKNDNAIIISRTLYFNANLVLKNTSKMEVLVK